jgi:peroxiredoxin
MSIAIAQTAPSFSLPGIDGRDHSLDDYRDARALVLVQSCNHCPYVQAWEGRLIAIQQDYAERGVRVVAIASNDTTNRPEDSFEQMQLRAQEQGFNFDYLYDESQDIARALGSERTPEVFVFDADRRLVYHGAIDDSRDETAVAAHYLRDALDAVLAGSAPAVADTPAVGCTVKWR